MVMFVLDMLTSIVILASSCNELRDFVAFAPCQRDSLGLLICRRASLCFMHGSGLVLSVVQNMLFKRLMLDCAVSAESRRWRL